MAGDDDDAVTWDILALVVIDKVFAGEAFDVFLSANGTPASWSVTVEEFFEEIFDEPHRIIKIHIDFFNDDAAFAFDFFAVEEGVIKHVTDYINGSIHVVTGDFDVVAGVFFAGESIEFSADLVEFTGDGVGIRTLGGAFEEHVFKEVGQAALLASFVFGTGGDHGEDGGGFAAFNRGGDEGEAAIELRMSKHKGKIY